MSDGHTLKNVFHGPLRPWFELVRLPAIFTAPSDVLLGIAIVLSLGQSISIATVVFSILASVFIYSAGMAMNDLMDRKIDAIERPSRPLPSGRVTLRGCLLFVVSLDGLGLLLAFLAGKAVFAATVCTVCATILYNGWAKSNVLGPFVMGVCRYGNAMIGLSVSGVWFWMQPLDAVTVPIGVGLYVASLTLVSRFEVGGESRHAARKVALVALMLGALGVAVPLLLLVGQVSVTSVLALGPFIWISSTVLVAWRSPEDARTRAVVMRALKGISIANAVLAAMLGQWYWALGIVSLLVPAKFVGRSFYST
ncbi:MAG: UbiA family prenyltransferase [Myxococcota bacterium]|nr:UbiA family prenyltransferase [Myxococcota bacterium]